VATDPAVLELKPDPESATGNIPDAADLAIVKAALNMATAGAGTFF
jgi:hypothetical protein